MQTTQGYIIIRHSILKKITLEEAEAAIRRTSDNVHSFQHVEITSTTKGVIANNQQKELQWELEAKQHQQVVAQQLQPLLKKYPDHKVVYFGAAPVALATYLGSLLGTWVNVEVFLLNHKGAQEWYLHNPTGKLAKVIDLEIECVGIPKEINKTSQDISITVETSYGVDLSQLAIDDIAKEIQLCLKPFAQDLATVDVVYQLVDEFTEMLNHVANNLPKIGIIHLITTVPVGLAFLLGTKISANVQPIIQLYQYDRQAEQPYIPVLKIGQPLHEVLILTKKEQQGIAAEKKRFEEAHWGELQRFIERLEEKRDWLDSWPKALKSAKKYFQFYLWQHLPVIGKTLLWESHFAVDSGIVDFNFEEEERTWEVGALLWFRLKKLLNDDEKQLFRAVRLLLFYKSVHFWKNGWNEMVNKEAENFSKLIESSDYQSVVWAMWYEYFYTYDVATEAVNKDKPSQFFVQLIDNVLATMWAWDQRGGRLETMPINRLNHYLNLYWQYFRLKEQDCRTIVQVAEVLAEKPVLEIKGLATKLVDKIWCYVLNMSSVSTHHSRLELGVLWKSKIRRRGSVDTFDVPRLVQAFRIGSSKGVSNLLNMFYSSVIH
ncbi:MAG: SAVED domain-containing protein [Aureispira sp.]